MLYEPPHGKTNNLHRRKQKTRISFAVTAKLISVFVFATRILQFIFYLNPKFQASSSFLCLYRPVCVGPVRKPHCWFSHELAQLCFTCVNRFAWTIAQCKSCSAHMGWKFTATNKDLEPQKFWGLCRASLVPGLSNPDDNESGDWIPVM